MHSGKFTTPQDRIKNHIAFLSSGCWLWTASIDKQGYGHIMVRGKLHRAHRYSYEAFIGSIPDGIEIDHTCHTKSIEICEGGAGCFHRLCVNPEHLEPVTRTENARRGNGGKIHAQRMALLTHCKYGHEFTEENTLRIDGRRHCRRCACVRAAKRRAAYNLANPPARIPGNSKKTHCIKGHPYDGDNLRIASVTGWRECRICRAEYSKQAYARKKTKHAAL